MLLSFIAESYGCSAFPNTEAILEDEHSSGLRQIRQQGLPCQSGSNVTSQERSLVGLCASSGGVDCFRDCPRAPQINNFPQTENLRGVNRGELQFLGFILGHAGLLGFLQAGSCAHASIPMLQSLQLRRPTRLCTGRFFWVRLSLPWLFEAMGQAEANIWMFVKAAVLPPQ